jgi:hypothetical protein
MDYFKMNLQVGLHPNLDLHSKAHPNHLLVSLKWPYMWVLCLMLGFHLKSSKSHMDNFEMNLNVGTTFKVRYSYNFAIPTNIYTSLTRNLLMCLIM